VLPQAPAVFKGPTSKGREGQREEMEGGYGPPKNLGVGLAMAKGPTKPVHFR